MSNLTERFQRLTPEQKELFRLRASEQNGPARLSAIPRDVRNPAGLPLSFAQQRMWLLNEMAPEDPAYNVFVAVRLDGPLDSEALRLALTGIVDRHESLRTRFIAGDDGPLQIVAQDHVPPLKNESLEAHSANERMERVIGLARIEIQKPFDLKEGPLRICIYRLSQEQHVVLFTMHHIVSDAWSMKILMKEMAFLYDSFVRGSVPGLPDLPLQYADFAVWQRNWLQGPVLEEHLQYWKDQLRGELPALQLPLDHPRGETESWRGGRCFWSLSQTLMDGLTALGKREGATLFMIFLAAFEVLLYRYTGQEDFVVGSPIANRPRPELQNIIGCFLNTLPLRSDIVSDFTFEELLRRVCLRCLGAYGHQDLPFDVLVEHLQPVRSLNLQPVFQVLFTFNDLHDPLRGRELSQLTPGPKKLKLSPLDIESGAAQFDIALHIDRKPEGAAIRVEFKSELFDAATIDQVASHFVSLLESAAENSACRLSEMPMLSEWECRRQLREFNPPVLEFPADRPLHRYFESQAEIQPEAEALVWQHQSMTYGELNSRANRLARFLKKRGVGPDVPVGVCMMRGLEMVVGILGVLKAGGAYVPLDPNYPAQRLAWIIKDVNMRTLLTQDALTPKIVEGEGSAAVLSVDGAWDSIAQESDEPMDSGVRPENLAYVLFTSGSTGRAKGVAISHRSASNFIFWAQTVFTSAELRAVLFSTSICFDLSVFELFATLGSGGAVVIAENALQVPVLPAAGRLTLINSVPSAVTELLAMNAIPASTKTVNLAGEALQAALVKQLYETQTVERVFNLYGPTEDTTYSTFALIARDETAVPAIGRPGANRQAYILDERFSLLPLGVAGQLFLGGTGLARCYYDQPMLTAEHFIPNPFASEPGARLYRTGDLARYRRDGNIEYLGRIDYQIKIRGFRVEPGEIEAALAEDKEISGGVVVARGDGPGRELVAYVVPVRRRSSTPNGNGKAAEAPADSAWVQELRARLRRKLPEYMVPSRVVVLDEMPLTPNGKINRKALPAPDDQSEMDGDRVEPETLPEEIIRGIFAEVLRRPRIHARVNFFEAGGHSLKAAQVIARVRQIFKVELSLRSMFESPTARELAQAVERGRRTHAGMKMPPLVPVPRGAHLPLSFAQERLWFLDRLQPGNPFYNVPQFVRIRGKLNTEMLIRALDVLVQRHESLRTCFPAVQGKPIQAIAEKVDLTVPTVDLTAHPDDQREAEMMRIAAEEVNFSFDLSVLPLIRARLLRLRDEDHVFLLNLHHIITDEWTARLLFEEIGVLYQAFTSGLPNPLPHPRIQYADYAVWQRQWLRGEVLESQLAYWRKHLLGAPPLLELPVDFPRPKAQKFRGATESILISEELTGELRSLGRRTGATLFMVLLAACKVLLARYSRQDDIVVGTVIANRTHFETEGLIGFFLNTLPLRTDVTGNPSFSEFIARVREVALAAHAHHELPLDKLVEDIKPERSLGHNPLFQVLFTETPFQSPPALNDLRLEPVEVRRGTSKFDLAFFVSGHGEGLSVLVEYDGGLFTGARIRRMMEHYRRILRAVAANPALEINAIPLLTPEEEHQLQERSTVTEPYELACVQEMVDAQARRTPEAQALIFHGSHLTYSELNGRANQLGHYLRLNGIGPGSLVGIFMERSAEMILAVLGILRAGAAYVPFDPEYPAERLSFMLRDAAIDIVLSQKSIAGSFPAGTAKVLSLDDRQEIAGLPRSAPEGLATLDDLAYVLYTSGSTGRPKGVCMPHKALSNLLAWHHQHLPIHSGVRTLQFTSLSFDVSFQEIFSTLCDGGTLVLISEMERHDPFLLLDRLRENSIHRLFMPFVALQQLAEAAEKSGATTPELREIITAGEQLRITPQIAGYLRGLPHFALHNHYGPTEAHVVTSYTLRGDPDDFPLLPPIGKPLPNIDIRILDDALQFVPPGVPGELCIGGVALAQGYLGRPDLTAARFIQVPFGGASGRFYRTGDLACYLADGAIQYLGRTDDQVKVRGYRVEPAEIEAIIGECPGVAGCAAKIWEDDGNKYIAAYIVPAERSRDAEEALIPRVRKSLEERVPPYMVPSVFVQVPDIPLTPSGKVDRRALVKPENRPGDLREDYVAPETSTQKTLVKIWAEMLPLKKIGVSDNFFRLGGHSLMATQVVFRIRDAFKLEFPVSAIFEAPTIHALASMIDERVSPDRLPEVESIPRIARAGALPLSYAQRRLWFIDQTETEKSLYNIPVVVRLRGGLRVEILERVLSEITRRHEVLRTRFLTVDGEPRQVVEEPPKVVLPVLEPEVCDEQGRRQELMKRIQSEINRPFNLSHSPLLRGVLIKTGPEEHVLVLTMHHIASDAWSLGVLQRELSVLYAAFGAGQSSPLQELAIQYADYAAWQQEWLKGGVLERQTAYWRKELAGAAPLRLAGRAAPGAEWKRRAARRPFQTSMETRKSLMTLNGREQVTSFVTLLAAMQVLLWRYTGQADISIGTPIANRNRAETEGLIGFFVNMLVMRAQVNGGERFVELVRRVRQVALGAYAHQDLPFEKLVEELQPERREGHTPLFQVMFSLQSASPADLHLGDLEVIPIPVELHGAKFDLAVFLVEREGSIEGVFEYDRDLLTDEFIERLVRSYERILEKVAEDPETGVRETVGIRDEEREQVLSWNRTGRDFPEDCGIQEVFERQVRRNPRAGALSFDGKLMSYEELNQRANRLAHYLRRRGVKRETLVGIFMERSMELIEGILGVLKAGGAYVPMDVEYPEGRLRWMLQSSGIEWLLTQDNLSARLPEQAGVATVCPDRLQEEIQRENDHNPKSENSGTDLAYVMYTSGSTGEPKGVMAPHEAVNRLVCNCDYVQLGTESVMLQMAPVSFDAATFEIWGVLLNGGRLVVMKAGLPELEEIGEVIRNEKVTVMWLTAPLFHAMAGERAEDLRGIKQLLAGGEVVSPQSARRYLASSAGGSFINGYGPTEGTTFSCCHVVKELGEGVESIPIGKAIANTQAYIVDDELEMLPVGAAGELCTGGHGLARGYLRRPELTAEKFVPNRFSGKPGDRMYRTGDLVRYGSKGEIEFMGRFDSQVKIRGFRVEPGEIEAALKAHEDIKEAVVMARSDGRTGKRLAAYLVEKQGQKITGTDELREYLKAKLPAYMVPAEFVMMESLPLTPNGKIDRHALPLTAESAGDTGASQVEPRDSVEFRLLQLWRETIGKSSLGVTDDFFAVGGHSLLAVQLLHRIRKVFGQRFPASAIFKLPTIEKMAAELRKTKMDQPSSPLVEFQGGNDQTPIFFAHPAGGQVLCYRTLADHLGPFQPVYAVESPMEPLRSSAGPALADMAGNYLRWIRAAQPKGPYRLGGWSWGGLLAFEMARQLHADNQEVETLVLLDTHLQMGDILKESATGMLARYFLEFHGIQLSQAPDGKDSENGKVHESIQPGNPAPSGIEMSVVNDLTDVFLEHVSAQQNYAARVWPGSALLIIPEDNLWAGLRDAEKDWSVLAQGGLTVHRVPGNHYTMMKPPYVNHVADLIKNYFAASVATTAQPALISSKR